MRIFAPYVLVVDGFMAGGRSTTPAALIDVASPTLLSLEDRANVGRRAEVALTRA
jgi:hypothetical protein